MTVMVPFCKLARPILPTGSVRALRVSVPSALLSVKEGGPSRLQLYLLKKKRILECLDPNEHRGKAAQCSVRTVVQMQFTFS